MNRTAIELNNTAIEELQRGNLRHAFKHLSAASSQLQSSHIHIDSSQQYRYHWVDLGETTQQLVNGLPSLLQVGPEGCTPFLFLRFLRISMPEKTDEDDDDYDIENLCPCGYSWSIWYK
jgi:hypothetical protein